MAFFTSLQVREDMGADSERYCGVVRVVTGISSMLQVAIAASGCSGTPSSAPAPRSTTTTEVSSTILGTPALWSVLELVPAEELDRVLHAHHSEITATARDAIVNGIAE